MCLPFLRYEKDLVLNDNCQDGNRQVATLGGENGSLDRIEDKTGVKITFEQLDPPKIGNQRSGKQSEIRKKREAHPAGAFLQQNGINGNESWMAGLGMPQEKGKTLTELQQEAATTNVAIQQDYRTVLSNTMSGEDYARMEEEGFHFATMDPETAVTIVDKIKAELAKSGQYIAGYTDNLDMDTLAAALGSDTLAAAVRDSFREADIPFTGENLDGVKMAWEMASSLKTPTESGYQYMVENEMEPEVWDFYLAQSSGAAQRAGQQGGARQPRFYAEDIEGYYTESANHEIDIQIRDEIDKVLIREGLAANEENRQAAERLLRGELPVTGENLARWKELENVTFPVTEEVFAYAAASSIAAGKAPIHANLAKTENIYDKAVKLLDFFGGEAEHAILPDDIVSRRQMEEVRLRMTAEVNVKLLRSGFAIDTSPIEELLEALRRVEAEVAETYFPADAEAVSKYELYQTADKVIGDLPGLPARILGMWSAEAQLDTLSAFHAAGKALQETYNKAQESYEALMTVPRQDLGDSIRKAFANVDDILSDLHQEINDENRRAVRILGYNRMNINAENVARVKAADECVQTIINKMTPASVLKMIRDGINPLEKSLPELEQYFQAEDGESGYEEAAENYSRFLYALEQNQEITQQERDAYIGIYRMLHQIEKSDGAAVGALLNAGAEIHFANLLSAVRSGKFKSMDVSVTEEFGAVVEVLRKGEGISEQIARGFADCAKEILAEVSSVEEAEVSNRAQEMEQIRQAALVDAECVELLNRGGLPQNADNLLAAQALLDTSSNPFAWKVRRDANARSDVQNMEEHKDVRIVELTDCMDEKETFREECQGIARETAREVQRESLERADSSMDVRRLQLIHKQLSVAAGLSGQEDYIFPMYIGEELAKVRLTLERGGEEKGRIDIAVDLDGERIEGHFQAENGRITGFLVGNTDNAVMKLQRAADIFSDSVQEGTESDWEVAKLPVTDRQRAAAGHHRTSSVNREVPDGEETYTEVDNTELYRIAKVFLKAVQK